MIIKLVGAVMILASSLTAARTLTSLEKEKAERLDSFIALIRYIRNRIDCYSLPIDKIFFDCPDDILDPLGGKEPRMSFDGLLSRKNVTVSEEARNILAEFSKTLGKNYRERQIKLCDGTIAALESLRDAEKKKYNAKKKTVNALCFAFGGMIILLLL